jgi:hypothetical protein
VLPQLEIDLILCRRSVAHQPCRVRAERHVKIALN